MSWIVEHKRVWRVVILGLLLMAIAGPWTFDRIYVPSKYPCDVRLEGDYCGIPLSGMWIIWAVVGEFVHRVVGLVMGTTVLADLGRLFLIILGALLLLLPFFSTLLLIVPGERQRQQIFHIAVWGLATAVGLWLLLFASEWPQPQLWGLWLYIALAPSVLILEVVALVARRRASQAEGIVDR
jgi:hypothetical protein